MAMKFEAGSLMVIGNNLGTSLGYGSISDFEFAVSG